MENGVEAMKMAAAAILFVLAFSVTMFMLNKAKTATEAVLDNLKIKEFFSKAEPLENNQTRRVGIETVIPTIYRYFQSDENATVKILDETGAELQVFDTAIETIAHNNFQPQNTDTEETRRYYSYLESLYGEGKTAQFYGAPWESQNVDLYYTERINAYIYGSYCKHMPSLNVGDQSIYRANNNYLMKYKGRTFVETYTEYRINGHVEFDDYGEEVVTVPATTKVLITYKLT